MSFGTTPENIGYIIVFGLAALALPGLLLVIGALIQRLFRIRLSGFSVIFTVVLLVSGVIGGSLYLDRTGEVVAATVTAKRETIHYRREGDWTHAYQVQLSYQLADGSQPSASFNTTAAVFDSLHEGRPTAVRNLSVNGWFNLTRLASQSTWTWIPWRWLRLGLAIGCAGWLAWKAMQRRLGLLAVGLVALGLICVPFVQKYRAWQTSMDVSRTPLRGAGLITEVRRVTTIDPLPSDGSGSNEWQTEIAVAQLYDIIVVQYTPAGYEAAVLGVDAIDVDSSAAPPLAVGDKVEIAYAASDPRTVRLPRATRYHHIRNPIEWLKQQALGLALLLAVLFGASWLGNNWRRLFLGR